MDYTKESLQKTWGVVDSWGHADYISEQCKLAGIISPDTWRCEYSYFSISLNELLFWGDEGHASFNGKKKITIPLPPKTDKQESIEWPQVGDDVVATHPDTVLKGKLLALTDQYAIISLGEGEQHLHLRNWKITKAKTPEEELLNNLDECILDFQCQFNEREDIEYRKLAGYILSRYKIEPRE